MKMKQTGIRRLLHLLLTLAMVFTLLPFSELSVSADDYDLTVAGVAVTARNSADILGDQVFRYDRSTKTLTIDGYCNYPDGYVINSGISGLTIRSEWDCTLIGDRGCVLLRADTTITGGRLTIKNTGRYFTALGVSTKLTLRDAELVVDGAGRALSGGSDNHTELALIDSELSAKTASTSTQEGAVMGFTGGISFEGCAVTAPENTYVSLGAIRIPGGSIPKQITVEKLTGRAEVQVGDYLRLGSYNDAPLLWRCVSIDENGPLMLADRLLCLKAYDAATSAGGSSHARDPLGDRAASGSNLWTDSNLRSWLNSDAAAGAVVWKCGNPPTADRVRGGLNAYDTEAGFLTNFTELELTAVKSVRQKCLVSELDPSTEGTVAYAPSLEENPAAAGVSLEGILGNYNEAYSVLNLERLFLPDVAQLYAVYQNGYILGYDYYIGRVSPEAAEYSECDSDGFDADAAWPCWLRTPVADTGAAVWALYPDGTIDSAGPGEAACDAEYGVRPAFYLDTLAAVGQGRGTAESPYTVFVEPGETPDPPPRPTPAPELVIRASKTELTVGESAVLTVYAANIDPSYRLRWTVDQTRIVVRHQPMGVKNYIDACTPGTAELTVTATVEGNIVARSSVTVTVASPPPPTPTPSAPPTPTPTPTPAPDFSRISLGNGVLKLYKGNDYLQTLRIQTDTGDDYFWDDEIEIKTYKRLGDGSYVESQEILSANTNSYVRGYDFVWVCGNAVGQGRVDLSIVNSNGELCTCSRYVTVTEPGPGVSSFTASIPRDRNYYPGTKIPINLDIQPAGALYQSLTFSSQDPSVAVVDQNGIITCRAPGQTLIQVELHNYGAKSRYQYQFFLLKVQSTAYYPNSYGYQFLNSAPSFGYPDGYKIPRAIFEAAGLSKSKAKSKAKDKWDGSCVGMSVSSMMFYFGKMYSALYSNHPRGYTAHLPVELKAPNTSSAEDVKLRRMIELFQAAQSKWYDKTYINYASGSSSYRGDRLRYMADYIKRGEPVVLNMRTSRHYFSGSGHAVVLYDYEYDEQGRHVFKIYDPSDFVDTLVFYKKDGDWTFWLNYNNHQETWYPLSFYTLSSINKGFDYLRAHNREISEGVYYAHLQEEEDMHAAPCAEELCLTLPEGGYTLTDAEGRTMRFGPEALSGELEGVRLDSDSMLTDGAEYTLTLPLLGDYALTGSGAGTVSYTVCDDVNYVELEVPAAATVHLSRELHRLGVSNEEPFDFVIRYVEFDNAFDILELRGTAQTRVDAALSGWEAEVSGADSLRAGVTVCGMEVERSVGRLSGSAVTVAISDERALSLRMGDDPICEATPLPERMDAMTPFYDLPGGDYDSVQTLTLSPDDEDETVIYYTTDGSAPTEDSAVYVSPITINRSMTVRAVASKFGYRDSIELRLDYVLPEPDAPAADLLGGHYNDTQYVRLSGEGTILYTLDGSDPAFTGMVYTQRLAIGSDTLLRAVCMDENGICGAELQEEYSFTRTYPIDTAFLLTDANGEPTQELAEAAEITFALTSYAEIGEGNVFLAYYDEGGKCLGVGTAKADLSLGADSVTLPLRRYDGLAEIRAYFCDASLAPIAQVRLPSREL